METARKNISSKLLFFFIVLVMGICFLVLSPTEAYAAPGEYNAADVAVINRIITENPSLSSAGWKVFTDNGSNEPDGWNVYWSGVLGGSNRRITTLYVPLAGLEGNLDVSGLTALSYLNCASNELTSINVSGLTSLISLSCGSNQLSDLSALPTSLVTLDCHENNLTNLDVSSLTKLTKLWCNGNNLTGTLGTLPSTLTDLTCSSNELTSLGILPRNLTDLSCPFNKLTSLDVSGLSKLTTLNCNYNELTGNLGTLPNGLTTLQCINNKLTNLGVLPTGLKYLYCQNNNLTNLGAIPNGLLGLRCFNNALTSLDISGCTVLDELFCSGNPLRELVVQNGTTLKIVSTGNVVIGVANDNYPVTRKNYGYNLTSKEVTLSAIAGTDSAFEKWEFSNGTTATNNPVTFTLVSDITVTAVFSVVITPESNVEKFVERLYTVVLNRASEPAGKKFHVDNLVAKKTTGADTAKSFFISTEMTKRNLTDSAFLDVCYKTFFDRAADSAGKKYWQDWLNKGMSRKYVLAGFINSAEFTKVCSNYGISRGSYTSDEYRDKDPQVTGFVNRLYSECLGRAGEADGLNFHAKNLLAGQTTGYSTAYGFVYSVEFDAKYKTQEARVTAMYKALLGRNPEKAGMDFWKPQTKDQIFQGMSASSEFAGICKNYGIRVK